MTLFRESFLLFSLNLLDALLTIIWIRNGVATEGNFLLAPLLEIGDLTFLGVKLAIGTFTAFVFLRFGGESRIAKFGISLALVIYISLMGVHLITGLSATGLISESFIEPLSNLSRSVIG
ncbi:MAG TPA: DUF5658 family protein [Pyrinomonadaceae bacterium]|jgi:hypothetical protein|nr:DUF5658 family protein [Pyrinomonadaceae bacterium]